MMISAAVVILCIWMTCTNATGKHSISILYNLLATVIACLYVTEGPVSVTTLGGMNALFHCNGSGTVLVWEVDGLPLNDQNIVDREITDHTVSSSSGTVQSTLTVPATSVNNGTSVRCFIGPSLFSLSIVGNYSTLTILPGMLLYSV